MPYIPLYTGDWIKDPQLSMCSPLTRGIWIDLLCAIHELNDGGSITGTVQQFTRICRCSEQEFEFAIKELSVTKTGHVTQCHNEVTIQSRRIARECKSRVLARERKRNERIRKEYKEDVTQQSPVCPPSTSFSSSISLSKKKKNKKEISPEAQEILDYLNSVSGKKFTTIGLIQERLNEGRTIEECKKVIDIKWKDEKFDKVYFDHTTLFRPLNFDRYLNQATINQPTTSKSKPLNIVDIRKIKEGSINGNLS